jgi:hypothetical protein
MGRENDRKWKCKHAGLGVPGSCSELNWGELPPDMQEIILGMVLADAPLAQLARVATLCKAMRAAYRERLAERHACIQERLIEFRSASWSEGWSALYPVELSDEHMALPHDLVVDPPVSALICEW